VNKNKAPNKWLFLIPIINFSFIFFSFYANHNLKTAILSTFVTWAFYVLCIPAFHGKIVLGLPYKIITGKILKYPELIAWPMALIFSIYSVIFLENIYFCSMLNHMFYVILTNPWPYWIALLVSAFATFYRFIIGYQNFFYNKYLHYILRFILILFSILILSYLSYNEFIILLNVSG